MALGTLAPVEWPRHALRVLAAAGVALTLACGSSTAPAGTPAIETRAGGGITDTIQAELVQALIVRVRNERRSGLVVRFEAPASFESPFVQVSPLAGVGFGPFAADTTDASGEAAVRIKLGWIAGEALLKIRVPEPGLVDSTRYTILPGAAAGLQLTPADTVLLVGGSFSARGVVVDRTGNPRPDLPTYESLDPILTVSANRVAAIQPGRGRVRGSFGVWSDTLSVSVVPEGILAALTAQGPVSFRTDGSNLVQLGSSPTFALTADWSPDGQLLAADAQGALGITVIGPDGVPRYPTLGGSSPALEVYPEFSPDGVWLYYSRESPGGWQIRRVHPAGSGDELVLQNSGADVASSLSPDGTRLAYTIAGPDELRLLDLASGTSFQLAPTGHSAAWSPTGELIAYVATRVGQEIRVIPPSGVGPRRVSPAGTAYNLGIDWSPDGKWLVGWNTNGWFDLIEIATGTTLPLRFTQGWSAPAWKR